MQDLDRIPPACRARFRPEKRLAAGGFGSVWLATQVELHRPVALKVLHDEVRSPDRVTRFVNEARIAAALSHENIVTLYDHGVDEGVPWIAYEYISGPDLRQVLNFGPLSPSLVIMIGRQVCRALEEAHSNGVIHRDIKPENVLQARPDLHKVTDFGISRWQCQETLTAAGIILGTPAYMSPLMIRGEAPSPATDIYALGVTLFELLTGAPPFVDADPRQVLELQLTAPVPRLPSDSPLAAVIRRSLAKTREDGFASASELRRALEAAARRGEELGTLATTRPQTRSRDQTIVAGRPPARRPRTAYLVGTLLAAAVFLLAWRYRVTPLPEPMELSASARTVDPYPLLFGGRVQLPTDALRHLERDDAAARSVIQELRQLVQYQVGPRSSDWIYWFQLNRWLSHPDSAGEPPPLGSMKAIPVDDGPAASLRALGLDISPFGRHALDRELLMRVSSVLPTQFATLRSIALEEAHLHPNKIYGWLLLGYLLKLQGVVGPAQRAFTWALKVKPQQTNPDMPQLLWMAAFEAMDSLPGHSVERDLAGWVESVKESPTPWHALVDVFREKDPPRLMRLLTAASTYPVSGGAAGAHWGEQLLAQGDYHGAHAAWLQVYKRFPGSLALNALLANHFIYRGQLDQARPYVAKLPATYREAAMYRFLEHGTGSGSVGFDSLPDDAKVHFLLEVGDLVSAELVIRRRLSAAVASQRTKPSFLELCGAGSTMPQLVEIIRLNLRSNRQHGTIALWRELAGELSSLAGRPIMAALLADSKLPGTTSDPIQLVRATWLSRSGQLAESLDVLERLEAHGGVAAEFADDLHEVLCRPEWWRLLGRGGAAVTAVAERARRLGQGLQPTRYSKYRTHLLKGELDQAVKIAQAQFLLAPYSPFWQLAGAWTAAARPGRPGFDEWSQRVRITLRFNARALWIFRELAEMARR